MAIVQNEVATATNFNNWVTRSITEFQRRNKRNNVVNWPAQIPTSVTADHIIDIPTDTIQNPDSDYISGNNIYQYILAKYKKMNTTNFPANTDITTGAIINNLGTLDGYLTLYEADPIKSSTTTDTHCDNYCTGLCVNNCQGGCSSSCTENKCSGSWCTTNNCSGSTCRSTNCSGGCLTATCQTTGCDQGTCASSCTPKTCKATSAR